MNAVAADLDESSLTRRVHGCERSYVEYRLNAWGKWIRENEDYEGYPRAEAMTAFAEGCGGGPKGSRPLGIPMPDEISRTHIRICHALSEAERAAIWLQYVPVERADGAVWSIEDRCRIAGVDVDAHRRRLSRAKLRYLGIVRK